MAAGNGQTATVIALMEKYPELKEQRTSKGTAIHIAATNGQTATVMALMEKYPELKEQKDSNGASAIHFAAVNGQTATVIALMEKYPELEEVKATNGQTPVITAIINGKIDSAIEIVKLSNNLDYEYNDQTILQLARKKGYGAIVEEIEKRKVVLEKIRHAEYFFRINKTQALLDLGSAINEKIVEGIFDEALKTDDFDLFLNIKLNQHAKYPLDVINKLISYEIKRDNFSILTQFLSSEPEKLKTSLNPKCSELLLETPFTNDLVYFGYSIGEGDTHENEEFDDRQKELLDILKQYNARPEITNKAGYTLLDHLLTWAC